MDFMDFNPNLLMAVVDAYNNRFPNNPNTIGASELPYGLRKNVIKTRFNLEEPLNMRMLGGSLNHNVFQKKKVMENLVGIINEAMGYETIEINGNRYIHLANNNWKQFTVEKETYGSLEVLPNKYIRMHSDIKTSFYTIEIKFTSMPKKMWASELAVYHQMQLNTYLGYNRHDWGILLRGDLGFLKSASTKWSYIWNNYFVLYPVMFDRDLFKYTINKAKQYFNYLENENDISKIPCPEHIFSCDGCIAGEKCPNPIIKVDMDYVEECYHCKQAIRPGEKAIIRNNNTYHYTINGERQEDCIKACKRSYVPKEVE